jgi:hypothetical protein
VLQVSVPRARRVSRIFFLQMLLTGIPGNCVLGQTCQPILYLFVADVANRYHRLLYLELDVSA